MRTLCAAGSALPLVDITKASVSFQTSAAASVHREAASSSPLVRSLVARVQNMGVKSAMPAAGCDTDEGLPPADDCLHLVAMPTHQFLYGLHRLFAVRQHVATLASSVAVAKAGRRQPQAKAVQQPRSARALFCCQQISDTQELSCVRLPCCALQALCDLALSQQGPTFMSLQHQLQRGLMRHIAALAHRCWTVRAPKQAALRGQHCSPAVSRYCVSNQHAQLHLQQPRGDTCCRGYAARWRSS